MDTIWGVLGFIPPAAAIQLGVFFIMDGVCWYAPGAMYGFARSALGPAIFLRYAALFFWLLL
jgi:hypothetical protein